MPSLGLVMILRNEEKNLLRSLKPVAHLFDEAVVVDTGSTDSTVKIARSLGACVHEIKWNNDFAAARNYSIGKAKADYLFWLDGDNAISPQDVARLRKLLETETGEVIGWGREILVPRGGSLIQKRLFPRRPDVFFRGRIHEQLSHPDWFRFVYLGVDILHWGYQDPAAAKAKGLRNLELLTEELEAAPGDFFLLYQKGKTLFNLRRYPEVLEPLSKALEIDPDSAQNPELQAHARILLGLARERTGDDRAAVLFEKTAESFPLARKIALFHLGRVKARESDSRAAMESLELFLKEPDQHLTLDLDMPRMNFQALMLLARLHRDQGEPEEGLAYLEQAVAAEPENPLPRRELVKELVELGRRDQARQALAGLAEMNPSDKALAGLKRLTG